MESSAGHTRPALRPEDLPPQVAAGNPTAASKKASRRRLARGAFATRFISPLGGLLFGLLVLGLAACAGAPQNGNATAPTPAVKSTPATAAAPAPRPAAGNLSALDGVALLDRITWGATAADLATLRREGANRFVEDQLRPNPQATLPTAVQQQIDTMVISGTPMDRLVYDLIAQRKQIGDGDTDEIKARRKAFNDQMERLSREAQGRLLLRELYSPNQLQEQMTWFWLNHFSVFRYKNDLRAVIGNYEDTIRSHALGRFRDLLAATVYHPAMIVYLDNERNAVQQGNENYARELMELHTLGVDAGYSQHDVQELARVLTGLGVETQDPATTPPPKMRADMAQKYVRQGVMVFRPQRHDFGDKVVLGHTIRGQGIAEINEVIDLLASQPATARHLSRQIGLYFLGQEPSAALREQLAQRYLATQGDIAAVLRELFHSPEFAASLHQAFKDPTHYVVSAVRLAYEDRTILNPQPMAGWLNRMGESAYGHSTPDGYPLDSSAWTGPGQMTTRFEIARAIGTGSAGLFRVEGQPNDQPAFPQLATPIYYESLKGRLAPASAAALNAAPSPQEWNMLLLASPEFMMR